MEEEAENQTDMQVILAQVMANLESTGIIKEFRVISKELTAEENKAQVRANAFHIIDTNSAMNGVERTTKSANRMNEYMNTIEGRNSMMLVLDFLESMQLISTMKVVLPEANLDDGIFNNKRKSLANQLDIVIDDECETRRRLPLIHELLLKQKKNYGRMDSIEEDNNGTIDKDELRKLFSDMFPDFHRNMLDRYVTDEFRAADKDFSNTIDFTEFLTMYRRLFILCKSVVSNDIVELVAAPSPRSESLLSQRLSQRSKIPKLRKKKKLEKGTSDEFYKSSNGDSDLNEISFEYDTKDRNLKQISSPTNHDDQDFSNFERRLNNLSVDLRHEEDDDEEDEDDSYEDDDFDSSRHFTRTPVNSKSTNNHNSEENGAFSEDELTTDRTVSQHDNCDYEELIN